MDVWEIVKSAFGPVLLCASIATAQTRPVHTAGDVAEDELLKLSPETDASSSSATAAQDDGWPDVSNFLDKAYGFLPIAAPITEPAVGYGAFVGLTFIDKPEGQAAAGFGRPNITAVGGLATDNGTWGLIAGDVRQWKDDRVQTLVGVGIFSVNLDFYGVGRVERDVARSYNLEPLGGTAGAKFRLGESRYWAGLSYAYASTEVGFDDPRGTPGVPEFDSESRVGGLTPSLTFDSRDNIFTPTRGTYVDASVGLFSEALGGDGEFQRVSLIGMQFVPLTDKVTFGVRGDAVFSFGDVPFYLRPFIGLRGVQVLRYQGEHVADVEAELRWQFWRRFSVVGFGGVGVAWNDFEHFDSTVSATAGGVGFRYELARKHGLHVGVDVAVGPDDAAIYIQFGSAWMRP